MKFAIRNAPGPNANATQATFESLEQARAALRDALGWPEVQLGPGYTSPNAKSQVWRAYRTHAEADADADADALNVPHVVRIDDVN